MAGEQDERGGLRIRKDTCDCDSESRSVPWSIVWAQETCNHDGSKAGQERGGGGGAAEWEVAGRWPALHHWGEPLLGWKYGVRVKGVPGVKEVERQLRVPCVEPRFEEPRVEK